VAQPDKTAVKLKIVIGIKDFIDFSFCDFLHRFNYKLKPRALAPAGSTQYTPHETRDRLEIGNTLRPGKIVLILYLFNSG
jgi:hypothetical protein